MSAILRGHGLRGEGAGHNARGERIWPPEKGALAHGKCECGLLSPPVASNLKRKGWHKWHKQQVAAALGSSQTFVLTEDQLDALRALLGLVHYDDLAASWLVLLPIEFRSRPGER